MPLKNPFRSPLLWSLAILTLLLQWFSASPARVERLYSQGVYPVIGRGLRVVFGWIPFSIGDLLYFAAGLWLAWRLFRWLRFAFKRQLHRSRWTHSFVRTTNILLSVYLLFELLWGLNYSRQGIATQLNLHPAASDTARLPELAFLLQERLCYWGDQVDSIHRLPLAKNKELFNRSVLAYRSAQKTQSILYYRSPSIKASLYTPVAHWFGFSGYYNPFTGEAQVHTGYPVFMRPFVTCHEMGHQLGYARENEANFAGFLACRNSGDAEFVYSAYFEMYLYTLLELAEKDRRSALLLRRTAHEQVRRDFKTYRQYIYNTRNNMEPVIMNVYDRYLRLNHQEQGLDSYNEVVQWLLALLNQKGPTGI
jgi:hypothetical protein